ncbi:MAG: NAD(+)/NADH kinase [Actinomycetota bacterium]|jgi:NAD+ kinase|nr:NAD(+)/NADH kinase [Actinomycetota bacterium]
MKIAVVAHLARPGAVELVRRTVELLGSDEHEIALHVPEGVGSAPAPDDLAGLLERTTDLPDLVISFGGDGTFLRAARIARDADAPVIGVNVGRVGFLAEIDPRELDVVLPQLAAGHYEIESRSTLEVDLLDAAGRSVGSGWALNDVAVEKVARERLVRLDVSIGGTPFANVAADAVIVATSTGSTAYALSAGGPIVNPTIDAMLIVPVAPHSLFDRTVITDLADVVTVRVPDDQDGALVSTDGMDPTLIGPGGSAVVRGGSRPVRVARLGGPAFFGRVRRTFRLA